MKAFKEIMWALLIYAMLWAALMFGIASVCHEVDMREEKVKHRRAYNQWLCDRALNEHITSKEWTR